jgi:hypothetical protein
MWFETSDWASFKTRVLDVDRLEALLIEATQPDVGRGARALWHQDHAAPRIRALPRPLSAQRRQP